MNAAVTDAVTTVFSRLYAARFPIRSMVPVSEFNGSDDDSMAADNTSGFNCRNAVNAGAAPSWSMHAYGDAIDVNTVENPYVQQGQPVEPPAGAAYTDRRNVRPGMAVPGNALNSAFAAVGWGWLGTGSNPDYQHFSTNGR